jgi:magnesium chelatase family protein
MALARCWSVALVGVNAHVVEVEVDVSSGLPGFTLSALSDRVLKGVEHRLRAAVKNSGEIWPPRRVTVALSPAAVPKTGSGFDLSIAVGLLAAAGAVPPDRIERLVFIGEVAISGAVKPITGVLPAVIGARRAGRTEFVVPRGNLREARLVPGAQVLSVGSLRQLCAWLRGEAPDGELEAEPDDDPPPAGDAPPDLADVIGQDRGREAIEIAAAGNHHTLLLGSPGVGKTMLAERLPGIMPDLGEDEALEVTGIHSIAGRLAPGQPLISKPPFFGPHHSATVPSIVGGGTGIAQPGAVSLAHRGVLFLDEAPEFSPRALDSLRQPLESGLVTLARASGITSYPARFLLVLAANQCPCAAGGRDPSVSGCICPGGARLRYQSKLSGPLYDRIDLRVMLSTVSRDVLTEGAVGESTATVRERVVEARHRARHRLRDTPWMTNGEVPGPVLRRRWPVPQAVLMPLRRAMAANKLSTRGVDRILKVCWTMADLAGRDRPGLVEVERAIELRRDAYLHLYQDQIGA